MNREQLEEILELQSGRRPTFAYYRDRYAPLLLELAADEEELARNRHPLISRLLRKEIMRQYVRALSGAPLTRSDLPLLYGEPCQHYRLTLGRWNNDSGEDWRQTTRPGCNLVLQLNFSAQHDREYARLVKPGRRRPFVVWGHPVHRQGRLTMSWSRIDLSFETGEGLIEEVQNDWLRCAERAVRDVRQYYRKPSRRLGDELECQFRGARCRPRELYEYVDNVLRLHRRWWAEATLTAAVWYLRTELGIREIYYHTHAWGNWLKRLDADWCPPVSLYEQLPHKLGFDRIRRTPAFLESSIARRSRRKLKRAPQFWYMAL